MNMRKIIAMTAAVLMLFTIIPMSAFAADGDVVASINWNDGEKKFDVGEVVAQGPDGSNCFKWAFNGGYASIYTVVKNMDSTKNYTITMKAKASANGNMGITIQNGDWGSYWNGPSFAVTTEWQDVVIELPANGIPFAAGTILFKFQGTGGNAFDLYVDDLVIAEGLPKKPIITNGDFEEGNVAPWKVHQQATAKAEAAYEGNYGAHLHGNGSWGGIMDTTLDVTAGKAYELSFWIKVNNVGINLQIKDGVGGANLASGTWFDKNSHSDWTKKTYVLTPSTNSIFLNFCGAGGASPNPSAEEDVYVDSIKVKELKDPSFDGYITNGDFETADTQSWESVWNNAKIEAIEGGHTGDYAMQINYPGQWQVVRQKVTVKPNTDYVYSVYAKNNNGAVLLVKDGADSGNIKQGGIASGSEWKKNSIEFNSGSNSQVYLCVMSNNAGDSVIVDDFFMFEKQPASNDGYLVNGTFETGDIAPWDNLWGSCPKAEVVKGGKDDNFSLDIVSGEWNHVRQTNIAVEANTEYKISFYSKNVKNMNLMVKDGADTTNLVNKGIANSDDWTLNEVTFNTGAYTSVLVSFMGGAAEAYGSFDNIVMTKNHVCDYVPVVTTPATCCEDGVATLTCSCSKTNGTQPIPATNAHTYDNDCDDTCNVSGEKTRDTEHNWADATCTAPKTCSVCGATEGEALDHTYDDKYDADCNVCGGIREVPARPVIEEEVQTSISEDVNGLAFKFDLNAVNGAVYENTERVYKLDSATVTINGEEYSLYYMGAIVTNKAGLAAEDLTQAAARADGNKRILNIGGRNLYELTADSLSFAVRIINIPDAQKDTVITTRPYFVYRNDAGAQVVVYGNTVSSSYNG